MKNNIWFRCLFLFFVLSVCKPVMTQTHFLEKLKGKETVTDESNNTKHDVKQNRSTGDRGDDDDDDDDRMSFICKGIDESEQEAMIQKEERRRLRETQEATRKLISEYEAMNKENLSKSKRPTSSSIRETIDIKARLQETERRLDALMRDREDNVTDQDL